MQVVCPDVSEFQVALNSTYPRDFIIFRACDGSGYQDHKFLTNAAEAAALYKAGRIAGAICYQVYRPVSTTAQYQFFWQLMGPSRPAWLKGVMLDAETWGGEISGNQSAGLNQLAGLHAAKMGWNGVIGYGNRGDLAYLWPQRDRRIRIIVASYGSQLVYTQVAGGLGQQYSDGQTQWSVPTGLPRATTPFGNCDHNVFPAYANGAALARLLQPATSPAATPSPQPSGTLTKETAMQFVRFPDAPKNRSAIYSFDGAELLWLTPTDYAALGRPAVHNITPSAKSNIYKCPVAAGTPDPRK